MKANSLILSIPIAERLERAIHQMRLAVSNNEKLAANTHRAAAVVTMARFDILCCCAMSVLLLTFALLSTLLVLFDRN